MHESRQIKMADINERLLIEPAITINGIELTTAQAMTLRVAIGSFAMSLRAEGLGDDEHGVRMAKAYLARASEIEALMARINAECE